MARSSAVEHYLDTVGVGGSRPPAPTNQRPLLRPFLYLGSGGLEPPRRSGGQVGARLSSDTKVDPPNDTNIDPLGM